MTIDILLATFDGQQWIADQLDSLLRQTDQDFIVTVRDDGSRDGTRRVLEEWEGRFSGRLRIMPRGPRLGAARNFAWLTEHSTAAYIMYCDQDDRWHPDKVAVFRAAMHDAEGRVGPHIPVLIHSDLRVVDAQLAEICPSYFRHVHLDPQRGARLERLLCQNIATGCASMANASLRAAAFPMPAEAVMHDWWLALIAAAAGLIVTIPRATVDYRQHGENVLGARPPRAIPAVAKLPTSIERVRALWTAVCGQASALAGHCGDRLDPRHRATVLAAASSRHVGWLRRRARIVHHGLWMHGAVRNAGHLLFS